MLNRGRQPVALVGGAGAAPAGSASSAGPPGVSGVTARPNYVGPSGNGLVERMNAGRKSLRDQGDLENGSFRLQKAVPRSKENAAVERREARRSALRAGSSLPLEGQARSQDGPTGRRSGPRLSALRFPLFEVAKGSKPTIGTKARRDAPRGNAPARLTRGTENDDAPI